MSEIKSAKVVINCVDYNDDEHVISKIGAVLTRVYDDKTTTQEWTAKLGLISEIEKVEKDNSIKVPIKTKEGTEVEIITEENGTKYLRTKGNTSKTDDLDDLDSCSKK